MNRARAIVPNQFFPNVTGLCSSLINTHLKAAKSSKHVIDGLSPGTPHMTLHDIAVGQSFSHYRLLGKLGQGGMGVVYLAEDTRLRRQVAIKFLTTGQNQRMSRGRFLREAHAASVLNHPNIATVHDVGETEDGRPFIVMELLRGQTLSDLLAAGTLTVEQGVSIIRDVLEALREAHRLGIIHRDIKPSNVFIGDRGQVKVLDFGLAKSLSDMNSGAPGDDTLSALPTQTLDGVVLGTPLYVSPEQATRAPVDERSDLFSVGAMLYECLTGQPAFAAPSVVEILARVVDPVAPPPPSTYNRRVTSELNRITLKALAKTAGGRYRSADKFLEDLSQVPLQPSDRPAPQALTQGMAALRRKIVSGGDAVRSSLRMRRLGRLVGTEPGPRGWQRGTWAVSAVATLALLIFILSTYRRAEAIDSIAVLPFVNESRDESLEYLSDGLTDSLILGLSRLPGMKVISRNSVAGYKGREVDSAAAGADLKVRAVLTGSVNRSGDELSVTAELVDARNGRVLWSTHRSAKVSDLVSLRQEIVRNVFETLHPGMTPERVAIAVKPPSTNPAAYELYMKGRWYWNKFTRENATQALNYFNQAVDADPGFALAHVGIADTYVLVGWVPSNESYVRAKAAVEKALSLDDQLGEAHATLGLIKSHYERDWVGAEAEFRRAIDLNPGYAIAHQWYASYFLARGQFENFFVEIKLAQELDPLSASIDKDVSNYYFHTRQYDRAIEHLRRNMTLFPNFYPTHLALGSAYVQKEMYAEAVAEFEKAVTVSKGNSLPVAMRGYAYARWGKEAEAHAAIRDLEAIRAERNVPSTRFALVYTALGDKDAAFEWLNRAYDERDIQTVYVNVNPFYDSLRDDPRFTQFVERLGLTPP